MLASSTQPRPGTAITFHGEGSFDPDSEIVTYMWDFDDDGVFDITTAEPTITYTYPGTYVGLAVLRVTSADAGTSTATATVQVDDTGFANEIPDPPTGVSVSVTGDEVALEWSAPSDSSNVLGFRVYDQGRYIGWADVDQSTMKVDTKPGDEFELGVSSVGQVKTRQSFSLHRL